MDITESIKIKDTKNVPCKDEIIIPVSNGSGEAVSITLSDLKKFIIDDLNISYEELKDKPSYSTLASTGEFRDVKDYPTSVISFASDNKEESYIGEFKMNQTDDNVLHIKDANYLIGKVITLENVETKTKSDYIIQNIEEL